MTFIGIDFSINSPGICIKKEDSSYHFIGFYNLSNKNIDKKIPKDYLTHLELSKIPGVSIFNFRRRKKHENYSIDQTQKVEDSYALAILIRDAILSILGTKKIENTKICIEGYSYGSKGNSFIDLIAFNSVVRNVLWLSMGENASLCFATPSQVKGLSGKGNANKQMMVEAFIANKLQDQMLADSLFYKWILDNKRRCTGENIEKPLDDLIDSYFVCNFGSRVANARRPSSSFTK